jgi:colanic acid/amylovoran biosynthesis glycosyltransferase
MQHKTHYKSTIGIVLSAVPRYSETFFRSKIKGLQDNGYKVILFVDYYNKTDDKFPCKVIASSDFNKGLFANTKNVLVSILKTIFNHPIRSYKLFRLDKKDDFSLKKRLKNLILNQFLLTQNINWLHFGFGMFALDRENIAEAIGAKMAVSFRGSDLYLSPLKHKNCYDI